MFGGISTPVLVVCLAASVARSALVRGKRSWDHLDITPYGHCGKPNNHISHGGIKLFPVTDIDDHHDNSCNVPDPSWLFCEPKFYCDDGYKMKGVINLLCVHNNVTDEYKWEGQIPTCVWSQSGHRVVIYVVPGVGLLVSIIIFVVCTALRSSSGYARFGRSDI
eukprot:XP_011663833.1 PREDICTED: uncharacterized protein LOC105438140 [Strongylocentrotus purpuratus]